MFIQTIHKTMLTLQPTFLEEDSPGQLTCRHSGWPAVWFLPSLWFEGALRDRECWSPPSSDRESQTCVVWSLHSTRHPFISSTHTTASCHFLIPSWWIYHSSILQATRPCYKNYHALWWCPSRHPSSLARLKVTVWSLAPNMLSFLSFKSWR